MKKFLIALVAFLTISTALTVSAQQKPTSPALRFMLAIEAATESPEPFKEVKEALLARFNGIEVPVSIEPVEGTNNCLVVTPRPTSDQQLAQFRKLIASTGKLAFHPVHPDNSELAPTAAKGEAVAGYELKTLINYDLDGKESGSEEILITSEPSLEGKLVKEARGGFDPNSGAVIYLYFNDEGSEEFAKLTKEVVGNRLAIVIDGSVISAPNLLMPISGGIAVVSGLESEAEAKEIAGLLNSPLPQQVKILKEEEITISE